MPRSREFTYLSCNGKTPIRAREWLPDGPVGGVVQIAHGIAEHIDRYDDFACFLAENGFAVVANDHLGHGKSIMNEDELGYFADSSGWEMAVGDMRRLTELTREQFPHVPYFLFGHSMGSFLARTYIIRYRAGISGVVLSGTGQQPAFLVTAGKAAGNLEVRRHGAKYRSEFLNNMAFGKYNERITHVRTISDWLSRDEAQVDLYVEDPLCGYIPTASLFRDMMEGIGFITTTRNVRRMKKDLPVYFMSGGSDPVGEYGAGVMRAYKSFLAAGMTDVTLKLYHEGRHEMLNELNRDEVYTDILAWLRSKMGRARD